jgi:hypothetical protein
MRAHKQLIRTVPRTLTGEVLLNEVLVLEKEGGAAITSVEEKGPHVSL